MTALAPPDTRDKAFTALAVAPCRAAFTTRVTLMIVPRCKMAMNIQGPNTMIYRAHRLEARISVLAELRNHRSATLPHKPLLSDPTAGTVESETLQGRRQT